jgi:hypothetical protein
LRILDWLDAACAVVDGIKNSKHVSSVVVDEKADRRDKECTANDWGGFHCQDGYTGTAQNCSGERNV